MNKYYFIHKINFLINNHNFRGKGISKKILRIIQPKMLDGIIVKTKFKFKLKIYPVYDKGIERKIFNDGIYEEGTLWCFQKLIKKGDIIFDVGANIGLTSIYAGILTGRHGKVFSFEPLPSTFNILKENIKLNNLRNIYPINSALSNINGSGFIYENLQINRGAASMYGNDNSKGIPISILTLDDFVVNNQITNIDFMKIDIEGAELSMLKGSMKTLVEKQKPMICVEFSREVTTDSNPELLFDLLKIDLKYEIFRQQHGKESTSQLIRVDSIEDLPQHDNLYCFQQYHYKAISYDLFFKSPT